MQFKILIMNIFPSAWEIFLNCRCTLREAMINKCFTKPWERKTRLIFVVAVKFLLNAQVLIELPYTIFYSKHEKNIDKQSM